MTRSIMTALDKYYKDKWKDDKKETATSKWNYTKTYTLQFMPVDWEKHIDQYLKESKRHPNRNKVFEKILKMTQKNLKNYVKIRLENMGYETYFKDGYVYGKGEIPVLLVAHLDTVHAVTPYQLIYKDDYLFSPQGIGGDDRCGVYMILEIIKELKCHVLFTEDEEVGCVGANKFTESGFRTLLQDKLNYIIEFDRRNGTDCVFYDCDNPEFESFIHKASDNYFKTAFGSCSDISYIAPALKVAAVNLSCGYYQEHTLEHYINITEMKKTIEKAKQIISTPCEDKFEYIDSYSYYNMRGCGSYYPVNGYYSSGWYDDYDYDYGTYNSSYEYKPTARSYHTYDTQAKTEIYTPHEGKDLKVYHIHYEVSYEFDEKVAEILANNEDEAVGLLMKENPSMCYGDIIEII